MEQFIQQLINGLAVGVIYALVALGYTMVYGVLKLINFAHGDLFTITSPLSHPSLQPPTTLFIHKSVCESLWMHNDL